MSPYPFAVLTCTLTLSLLHVFTTTAATNVFEEPSDIAVSITALHDPSHVPRWILIDTSTLKDKHKNQDVFTGYYDKQQLEDITEDEMEFIEKIGLEFQRQKHPVIWKQKDHFRDYPNYLLLYPQDESTNMISWIVATFVVRDFEDTTRFVEKDIIWWIEMESLLPFGMEHEFPNLKYPTNPTNPTNQKVNEREIERLKQRIKEIQNEGNNVQNGMIDEREHWFLILKWNCIVGAVTALFVTLVNCCGFKYFYSNRKKKWEIQRLRNLLSAHNGLHGDYRKADEIIAEHRRVSVEIIEGMEGDDAPGRAAQEPERYVVGGSSHQFGDLMLNSVAVQSALMDDVLGEMKTEGAETVID